MATEREYLNKRLDKLNADRKRLNSAPRMSFVDAPDPIDEQLETIRAERRDIEARLVQLDQADAERADAAQAEDSKFWFRRFFTTLAIANGAAFVALANGFLQADDRAALAPLVHGPMTSFAIGMFAAGAIPFWLGATASVEHTARRTRPNPTALTLAQALITGAVFVLVIISIAALLEGTFEAIDAIKVFGR